MIFIEQLKSFIKNINIAAQGAWKQIFMGEGGLQKTAKNGFSKNSQNLLNKSPIHSVASM